jgi:hypothetical protein
MEEINIKVTSVEVKGKERKIKFKWTPTPIEDAPIWITPKLEAEFEIEFLKDVIESLMLIIVDRHGVL